MNPEHLIANYGYWVIAIGCLAEGETVAILGGVAAHQGLLRFENTVLMALLGSLFGDQLLFWLGRYSRGNILHYLKKYEDKIARASHLIHRRPALFVIGMRFMYGFRLLGPIIIGNSGLNPIKFFFLNLIGAVLWAIIFVTLGYYSGQFLIRFFHRLDHHLHAILWVAAAICIVLFLRLLLRRWVNRTVQ